MSHFAVPHSVLRSVKSVQIEPDYRSRTKLEDEKEIEPELEVISRESEDLDEVFEGLYVGALDAAESADVLRRHGISNVVSIIDPCQLTHHFGIRYRRFWLVDDSHADISKFFTPCFRFVRRAMKRGEKVLIH